VRYMSLALSKVRSSLVQRLVMSTYACLSGAYVRYMSLALSEVFSSLVQRLNHGLYILYNQ
jgi:hypothetical protein